MPRPLRFVPCGHMVEITLRTIQGRHLLQPTAMATRTIAGVIGRAQRQCDMEIHAVVAMSNHVHLLISPRSAQQMARFMNQVGSNVARRIGKLVGWRERFWGRRYRAIVVSNEAAAQVGRLRYLLAHGAKEGFVPNPVEWPGVHAARALCDGSMAIEGEWLDLRRSARGPKGGGRAPAGDSGRREAVVLSPLPCWRGLSGEQYRAHAGEMIAEIERATLAHHRREGTAPKGHCFVLAGNPHARGRTVGGSPAPAFHAASQHARVALRAAYSTFVAAYREAAERLRKGRWPVSFPSGCFPPALPFVPG